MLNHFFKVLQFVILPFTLKVKILFFSFWIISFFYILAFPSRFNLAFAGTAALSWTTPTTNTDGTALTDLAGFKVYYGTSSGNYGTPIDAGNQTSYTVSGLGSGTYFFSVTAYDTSGVESAFATEATKIIVAPPPVISGVAATNVTGSGATISWTTDILSSSQVEYGTTASYGLLSSPNLTLSTSHSQTISGLQASTTYHYRVKSADQAGNMTFSGDYLFTTASASENGGSLIPPAQNPSSGPTSTNFSSQQTPTTGGCGMIMPKNGKSVSPGEGADFLAILSVCLILILRKTFKESRFQCC